jgi:RNA-directed DNA polymerase
LGVHNLVVQPVCLDEQHKGVNPDKRDAKQLALRLDRYVAGNPHTLAPVRVPTPAEEQRRIESRQRERLERWLAPRGLKLNETKTRVADSRRGFDFLGLRVRWQRSRVSRKRYAHVEASPRSQQRLREAVRAKLNHWTLGQRIPEVMAGLNRLLRSWSGYFHYRHSSRVMGQLNWQVRDRVRRWLWRQHARKRALWTAYPDERLHGPYGLWRLPEGVTWQRRRSGEPNAL